MEDCKCETLAIDDRPIIVSEQEVEKHRRINAYTRASFAVDNLPVDPDTQHIFEDFVEGSIATNKEVKELLHTHYNKLALKDR